MNLIDFLKENDYDINDCIDALDIDDKTLLDNMDHSEIQDYSEYWLDMIHTDDIPPPDLWHFSSGDLFTHLIQTSGYIESLLPSLEDSLKYIQEIGDLERNHGYFTFIDKFEEFKQNF